MSYSQAPAKPPRPNRKKKNEFRLVERTDDSGYGEDELSSANKPRKNSKTPRTIKRRVDKQHLPSGLPQNWPNSTNKELADRPVRYVEVGNPQKYLYRSNYISTAQYGKYDFLPRFLLKEFNPYHNPANTYFLFIAILQCIPSISNTYGYPTTLIPLMFVLLIDGFILYKENQSKRNNDLDANGSTINIFSADTNAFVERRWSDVEVGDFVQIHARCMVPADVILLSVAEKSDVPSGKCFIESRSIDGETTLKRKVALEATYKTMLTVASISRLTGNINMEHPNRFINSFNGVINLDGIGSYKINHSNVLLRGCILRNCDWALGLVVNTGLDTKIHMNSPLMKGKSSKLIGEVNRRILHIMAFLVCVCLFGSLGQLAWDANYSEGDLWYLQYNSNPGADFFLYFFHFLLIHSTFIPVSLYVSIVIVRYFQTYFMQHDLDMFHKKSNTALHIKNMSLNEDLGQITHIIADKTGTLTCNVMDFRRMSVHGLSYGTGITSVSKAKHEILGEKMSEEDLECEKICIDNKADHVSFYSPAYDKDMSSPGEQRQRILDFFHVLAICHDADFELDINGRPTRMSALSPEDTALLHACDYFGYKFLSRDEEGFIEIENKYNKGKENYKEKVEILYTFPVSAARNRITVIARDPLTNEISLYCKGSDIALTPLLRHDGFDDIINSTALDKRKYTEQGLRCLYVARKQIKENEYTAWVASYEKVMEDVNQIERQRNGKSNNIDDLVEEIEKDMILLGCTALEDRLQDGVSDTIEELLASGIHIWMASGDDEITGHNIGLACKLLLPETSSVHVMITRSKYSTKSQLKEALRQSVYSFDAALDQDGISLMKPWFLVIDGTSIAIALKDEGAESMRELLIELSLRCKAVLCCRVSPAQKSDLVNFLCTSREDVRVMAVGDGSNDIAMIQEAHVGVAISGVEKSQATNAADYSVAQFRYLSPLILKHGQFNYIRLANLVCFTIYKNILMSLSMFWFNFSNGYSGQKYFTEGLMQIYNVFLTSLPILYYAIYDQKFSKEVVYRFPQVYRQCIHGHYFTVERFWTWVANAVFESIVLSITALYCSDGLSTETGALETFWQAGLITFTCIVIIANVKLLFIQTKFHYSHYMVMSLGIFAFFAAVYVISSNYFFDDKYYGMLQHSFSEPYFGLNVLLCVIIVMGKDAYTCAIDRHFNFYPYHIIQELDAQLQEDRRKIRQGGKVMDIHQLVEQKIADEEEGERIVAEHNEATGGKVDDDDGDEEEVGSPKIRVINNKRDSHVRGSFAPSDTGMASDTDDASIMTGTGSMAPSNFTPMQHARGGGLTAAGLSSLGGPTGITTAQRRESLESTASDKTITMDYNTRKVIRFQAVGEESDEDTL